MSIYEYSFQTFFKMILAEEEVFVWSDGLDG